jgi:hypothetical protein
MPIPARKAPLNDGLKSHSNLAALIWLKTAELFGRKEPAVMPCRDYTFVMARNIKIGT